MAQLLLKATRYFQCYADLLAGKPRTPEEAIDYCVDRPILIGQVRAEIIELAKLLKEFAPKRSLEIGTQYGGTLLLLCRVSPPGAKIISLDLPSDPASGSGYPPRKIPLYKRFPTSGQQLHLVRADSHSAKTKEHIEKMLKGEQLDYLFIDADHSYDGVRRDFEMYSPLVRSGGIVALHDIVVHSHGTPNAGVREFWAEIKQRYRYLEFIEDTHGGPRPIAVTRSLMDTAGLGVLYMP